MITRLSILYQNIPFGIIRGFSSKIKPYEVNIVVRVLIEVIDMAGNEGYDYLRLNKGPIKKGGVKIWGMFFINGLAL